MYQDLLLWFFVLNANKKLADCKNFFIYLFLIALMSMKEKYLFFYKSCIVD